MNQHLILNNDVRIRSIGFGVFQSAPGETAAAVETALHAGYRHIDTAAVRQRAPSVRASAGRGSTAPIRGSMSPPGQC